MFCYKCGTKINDKAVFCHKCGTKVKHIDASESASVNNEFRNERQEESEKENQTQGNTASTEKDKRLRYKGLFALVSISIVLFLSILFWPKNIDYEEIVKTCAPYQELSCTYLDLFERYIKSPKWKTRKTDDGAFVDVSGKLVEINRKITITMKVDFESEIPGQAVVYPAFVEIDNKGDIIQEPASDFVNMMFMAYSRDYNDLSSVYQLPRKEVKLGPVQTTILFIILIIAVIAGFRIVNKLQQMYMGLTGTSIMFYDRRKKGFAVFMVTFVVFCVLMLPFMAMWGYL